MRTLATAVLVALVLLGCKAAYDDTSLLTAADAYVRQNSVPGQWKLRVIRKSGDYARLAVDPVGDTDPATLFMRLENGTWTGVSLGTGSPPSDLRALGIPEPLWEE